MEEKQSGPDLERLIGQYGTGLLRMCFLYLHDIYLAEDAVQDTYLKVYENWERFEGRCSEKTWITGIAMNVCRSLLRSPWSRRVVCREAVPEEGTGPAAPGDLITDDTVLAEVGALKPDYREAVLLFYYQELSTRETAEALGITENAVSVRLNRARRQLRKKLKGWYFDE